MAATYATDTTYAVSSDLTGEARADVLRVAFQHRVEGPSRFPVLVPTGSPTQGSELEPDVVEIQLAEEEQRCLVGGGHIGSAHGSRP